MYCLIAPIPTILMELYSHDINILTEFQNIKLFAPEDKTNWIYIILDYLFFTLIPFTIHISVEDKK